MLVKHTGKRADKLLIESSSTSC